MCADDESLAPRSGDARMTGYGRVEASHHLRVGLPAVLLESVDVCACPKAVVVSPAVGSPYLPKARLRGHLTTARQLLHSLQRFRFIAGDVVTRVGHQAGQSPSSRTSLLIQLPKFCRNLGQHLGHGVTHENQTSHPIDHEREVSQAETPRQ